MADFNTILTEVSASKTTPVEDDSVRTLSGASLVAGVTPKVVDSQFISQTVRISSGGDNDFRTGDNQSDRSQVPPATDNKLPRIYGKATTGGVIVDAHKTDANTLIFAMVLSEMDADRFDYYDKSATTWDPAFTIDAVYRDNDQCTFSASTGNKDQVITLTDLGDGSTRDVSNANISVWAWAGNSSSTAQIFPDNRPNHGTYDVNAYDIFPTWDSNVTMEGTVFAIVQVTYLDQEAPLAEVKIDQFGSWRFTVQTEGYVDEDEPSSTYKELYNPGYALWDYLTSDRYGVSLSNADIDTSSLTAWADYCEENVAVAADYLVAGGSSATFPDGSSGYINNVDRYRIDGFINTQRPVRENIDTICAAGQATFGYNNKTGLFQVLVNRPMTVAEEAAAFHFTSDNITSRINVSTTDLYSLFNFAEVTFPNYLQQDAADTVFVETPTADKLQNEPISGTSFALPVVSDRPRAASISNVNLKQSRVGTVAKFTADHSTMVVDVGDFVKVSDQLKGWDEKFFRVIRITESENGGAVTCSFTLAEYQSEPFEEIIYYDTTDEPYATGFGEARFWYSSGALTFDSIYETFQYDPDGDNIYPGLYVYDYPASGFGNIVYTANAIVQSSVSTGSSPTSVINVPGGPDLTNESWLLLRNGTGNPGEPDYSNTQITISSSDITTGIFIDAAGQQDYDYVGIPVDKLPQSGSYTFDITYINATNNSAEFDYSKRVPPEYSNTYTSAAITVNDRSIDGNAMLNTYGTNSQIVDLWPDYQTTPTAGSRVYFGTKKHDVVNSKSGVWTYQGEYTVYYDPTSFSGAEYLNVAPGGNIMFVNSSNITNQVFEFNAPGVSLDAAQIADPANNNNQTHTFSSTISFDPADYGLTSDWYASRCNAHISVQHNSLTNIATTDTSYSLTNQSPLYRSA